MRQDANSIILCSAGWVDGRDHAVELGHQRQVRGQAPDAVTVTVVGYAEDLFRLAVTAKDRADLHTPPFQVAGQGLGGADKACALTVFGGLHGGFGIEVALIFPEVRQGQPRMTLKSLTSMIFWPPSLMKVRRSSRSSRLTQSLVLPSTRWMNASFWSRPEAVSSLASEPIPTVLFI
ncbi:hypothetical protein PsexTeo8_48230 [Pseudomonas extremaustralis]|nr:hypothetical protein [Pseudomonas extremaustralis]